MSDLRQKIFVGFAWLTCLTFIGCGGPPSQQTGGIASPTTQALSRQVQEMDTEIKRLQDTKKLLEIEKADLVKRAEKLQSETRTLKFLNEQMEKQLAALAEVPVERDMYKSKFNQLALETLELRMRAERLEKVLAIIQAANAATQPASTQPTSQPDQP
ncbi:MAG: hypothetical protein EHM48_02335 [Planctomycetaceae bacterium]|nr:MAG: hypothetical protein EHM48_02335 [Planctomycetaceae bacterium]